MLWNASALKRYAIAASDGPIGTVSDFLFDDASWLVRWLVVDTGNWLPGRKVLLPPSALGQLDAREHEFSVTFTKHQIKESPEIDTDRPMSRQMETSVYDYYGWSPYWGTGFNMGGYDYMPGAGTMGATSIATSPFPQSTRRAKAIADAPRRDGDPHLRSIAAVTGYHIHASDGEIGHVEDFPRRGYRLEHSFPGCRYVELVVRGEGADRARVGTKDRLDGSAGEPRCRSSEGQKQPIIQCVQDCRLGL